MLPPIEELVRGKPDSLFGLRAEWPDDEEPVPEGGGWVAEYIVARGAPGQGWTAHRLMQRGGIAWSTESEAERADTLPAREIRDPSSISLGDPPRWKKSEARRPTLGGEPMTFVGEVPEPGSAETIFLFWRRPDSFKAWTQDLGAQTAEEHYALEERLNDELR